MNKKIIAIFTLLIVAGSISAVSAFDLGSLFGSNDSKTVDVNGIDFNVPSGFEEEPTNITHEANSAFKELGLNVTTKIYMNNSNSVGFYVSNFTSLGLSSQDVLSCFSGDSTTINNVTGIMYEDNGTYMFTFVKDGCVALVDSDDKNLINDVVIA